MKNMVDQAGPDISGAETVTVLNDWCFLAPGALTDPHLAWSPIDDRSAAVTMANGPYRVQATCVFNERDELVNFCSDDRPDSSTGRFVPCRWRTPLGEYRQVAGLRLPTYGTAVWIRPEGEFTYGEFRLRSIEYDLEGRGMDRPEETASGRVQRRRSEAQPSGGQPFRTELAARTDDGHHTPAPHLEASPHVTAWQRRTPLALIAASLVALVVMSATLGAPTAPAPTADSPAPSTSDYANATPRIAIVYDTTGRAGAGGFNDLAYQGAKRAADHFGAELLEVTSKEGETDADREARLTQLANARYDPIFVIGSAYAPAVAKIAPVYPTTWFGLVGDGSVDAKNVIGILFHEEQGAYLVGAAAVLTSTTGSVGFIGGAKDPVLEAREAGFRAGARAAKPKTTVRVTYLPRGADAAQGRTAALAMYRAGVDVIFATAGDADRGVLEAAHEQHRWVIGADSDRYLAADATLRDAILTSMLKRADKATFTIAMEVATGVPKDGTNVFGLERDGVGYATSGGFVDPIKARLDAFAAKIATGEILVPTKP